MINSNLRIASLAHESLDFSTARENRRAMYVHPGLNPNTIHPILLS